MYVLNNRSKNTVSKNREKDNLIVAQDSDTPIPAADELDRKINKNIHLFSSMQRWTFEHEGRPPHTDKEKLTSLPTSHFLQRLPSSGSRTTILMQDLQMQELQLQHF